MLLPLGLSMAGCGQPSLADLLPDGPPGEVELTARISVPAAVVGQLMRGDPAGHRHVKGQLMRADFPDTPERAEAATRAAAIRRAAGRRTLLTVGETRAVTEGLGEADERAARKLGVGGYPYQTLCAVLWGRSLSAERDARLAATTGADAGSAASVTARRGQVSRQLLSEARALLARTGDRKD